MGPNKNKPKEKNHNENLQKHTCANLIELGKQFDLFTKFALSSWWIDWLKMLLVNGLIHI